MCTVEPRRAAFSAATRFNLFIAEIPLTVLMNTLLRNVRNEKRHRRTSGGSGTTGESVYDLIRTQ